MVFFDDQDSRDESLHEGRSEETSDTSDSASVTSPTCSQLFVEVRGHSHSHPVRIDLAVSSLTREVDSAHRGSSSVTIPARSVASLRPLFDIPGPSSTYIHGRELGGRSSVLALQVPASSLPPPLTASAIVDSFQISASSTFFSPLPRGDEASPSTRQSLPCVPCQASQNNARLTSASMSSCNSGPMNGGLQTTRLCAVGQGEVVRRLTEVLQGRGDDAFVLQSSGDNMMMQWLQALDVHVVGACRADERLQPILRWNTQCSGADGQLLAHLSQHFKLKELGMLARCLCLPLVSIRVGKVHRQDRFLCPTASRGYLSLTMLPCSEMRLSFIGDNGEIERIAAVKSMVETHVSLEMLEADPSGRSFMLKVSNGKHYFWQSERSKTIGDELVTEMRDFLLRRPALSQLTGVHESRLNSFVSQLRNNLAAASSSAGFQPSCTAPLLSSSSSVSSTIAAVTSPTTSSCGIRQSPRLSPRANGFKEGTSRSLTNSRSFIMSREKHRRRWDKLNPPGPSSLTNAQFNCSHPDVHSDLIRVCRLPMSSICSRQEESTGSQNDLNVSNTSSSYVPGLCGLLSTNQAAPCPKVSAPLVSASLHSSPSLIPSMLGGPSNSIHLPVPSHLPVPTSTLLAPYYCPCPLRSSALQYTFTPPFLPPAGELNTGPASSTFYSVKSSSALLAQTTISLDRVSISPIPLPVSSLVNIPTPLQTPSLSSFFSDPIVHVPVVDFQSGNKSFFVSAPPPVSSSGLPSFLNNILAGGERLIDGEETSGMGILQSLGIPCWREDEHRERGDVHPFLINGRLLARCTDDSSAKHGGVNQVSNSCWSTSSATELNRITDFSCPLVGMVPTILTSGSLSCVLNFHPERSTPSSAWVSGSRGLYGGTCEAGILAPSITACSTSLGFRIRGADVLQTLPENSIHGSSQESESESEEDEHEPNNADQKCL